MLVAHVTTVHQRGDVRIRHKECMSLVSDGRYRVRLIVADSRGDEVIDGLEIRDLGMPGDGGRTVRWLLGSWRVLREILRTRPRLLHFHDPELLPVFLFFRLLGHRVVYDVHEDLPTQMLAKHWLPKPLRRILGMAVAALEWIAGRTLSGMVAATPTIAARFPASKTVLVRNFPLIDEFSEPGPRQVERPEFFAYVGVIASIRGAEVMVDAVSGMGPGTRLLLAGNYSPDSLRDQLQQRGGWSKVVEEGWLEREAVATMLNSCRAGLVLLQPLPNYVDALPVKLFEYMAAGIPVIASDFPGWREIIEPADCGILVDPADRKSVTRAMSIILSDPEEADAMGARGRQKIESVYNFAGEADQLIGLYRRLLPA
ncbi:MAG: glycosyltransferase family 4 protein [Pseudomonadales bacterium]